MTDRKWRSQGTHIDVRHAPIDPLWYGTMVERSGRLDPLGIAITDWSLSFAGLPLAATSTTSRDINVRRTACRYESGGLEVDGGERTELEVRRGASTLNGMSACVLCRDGWE